VVLVWDTLWNVTQRPDRSWWSHPVPILLRIPTRNTPGRGCYPSPRTQQNPVCPSNKVSLVTIVPIVPLQWIKFDWSWLFLMNWSFTRLAIYNQPTVIHFKVLTFKLRGQSSHYFKIKSSMRPQFDKSKFTINLTVRWTSNQTELNWFRADRNDRFKTKPKHNDVKYKS